MTHEPECAFSNPDDVIWHKDDCICEQLLSAYKRGREDAAERIQSLTACYVVEHGDGWDLFCREHLLAAARGDGEQA